MTKPNPKPPPPLKPSKITVPKRCHPAAAIVFAEMRRQSVTYDELEFRSGVLKSTFKAWRTHNKPGLETLSAALGALGWEFLPVPPADALPAETRAALSALADAHGFDEDAILGHFVRAFAHRPLGAAESTRGWSSPERAAA